MITAGLPRKPGMSRMDLIEVNAKIVRSVAENVAQHSPNAVIIVVSNPLDEMTALTQLASGFPKSKVIGQAGMLDTARFTNFVAVELGVPVGSVQTLTLGSHGDTMVPVPSRCTVDGEYGIEGVYLGVEAEIGRDGIRRIVEGDLTETELAGLKEAAEAVRAKQADVQTL